jgi:hypothetical protein
MTFQIRNWEEIRRLLMEARAALPPGRGDQPASAVPNGLLVGTLDEFDEFLEHNELELAWDALAEVAERCSAPKECWGKLARAADLMQLPDKRDMAQRRATSDTSSRA